MVVFRVTTLNQKRGRLKSGITLAIMLIVLFLGIEPTLGVSHLSAVFPVHNVDTGKDYATIQAAIDDSNTNDGHTILVDSGIYYENVQLWKSLKLIGEDPYTTVIDGNGKTVLNMQGHLYPLEDVTVSGFTMRNGSFGMLVSHILGKANITNNIVNDNIVGISATIFGENIFFRKNSLLNNIYGFDVRGVVDVDTTNTINGKPIYFFVNQNNILVDPTTFPDVGYIALIKCANITVKDLTLSSNGQGILLKDDQNITLLHNKILNNLYGIDADTLSRSLFVDNIISHNGLGMFLFNSRFNNLIQNRFENNTFLNVPSKELLPRLTEGYYGDSGATSFFWASNNTMIGNTIANNDEGIDLVSSGDNTLRNNTLTNNTLNFGVRGFRRFSYFENDIDSSNTVNGKSIIYWVNQRGQQVPLDAGYVALINCTYITIKNLNLSKNRQGVLVVSSNNSIIDGNKISEVAYGILIQDSYKQIPGPVYPSVNDTLSDNEVTACGTGILIRSGWNHVVSFNNLSHNLAGIIMKGTSSMSMILGNTVTNSTWQGYGNWPHESWAYEIAYYYGCTGIIVEGHSNLIRENTVAYNDIGMTVGLITLRGNNEIYHNNFIRNTGCQLQIGSRNTWDNGYPSGGNYWSDYTGVDLYHGPYQNQTGSDRIGDTPYLLDKWTIPDTPPEGKNQHDNYPLMNPWAPPGVFADLARRKAWPEHFHFDISKDEDGYQTFYAKLANNGNRTVWGKTVFNVTKENGTSFITETNSVLMDAEKICDLSANFGPLSEKDTGQYLVSVTCWYSNNKIAWAQGEKRKTFKFTIIP